VSRESKLTTGDAKKHARSGIVWLVRETIKGKLQPWVLVFTLKPQHVRFDERESVHWRNGPTLDDLEGYEGYITLHECWSLFLAYPEDGTQCIRVGKAAKRARS
jgi:hypothetical protein